MLAYLLSVDELREILDRLDYRFTADALTRTVAFYRDRVSHGSTLSRVAHAWVSARADRHGSWQLFREALSADLDDTQGGTTAEGIHLGAMAATLDILQRRYTGLEVRDDALWLHPQLPEDLAGLRFTVTYRGQQATVDVNHHRIVVALRFCAAAPIDIVIDGLRHRVSAGETRSFPIPGPGQ